MRITSGILKGRTFKVPKIGVRPTTERTREAMFSSLAPYVPEAKVLDLFAGAGGLSLEAWSRGASSVTAVEKVPQNCKNLEANFKALENDELGTWKVVRADVYDYLKRSGGPFDLVFSDPPYEEVDLDRVLSLLGHMLAEDGILVFEMHKRDSYTLPPEWALLKEKKYGSTKVVFLERKL